MSFTTNQIIRRNKRWDIYIYICVCVCVCVCVCGYLINCEYFNNLNGDGDMVGICTSPYPIEEKVGDSPYPYQYPVNAGILCQNGDEFEQYPRRRVYLPSLGVCNL